jgi:hypothetical protein
VLAIPANRPSDTNYIVIPGIIFRHKVRLVFSRLYIKIVLAAYATINVDYRAYRRRLDFSMCVQPFVFIWITQFILFGMGNAIYNGSTLEFTLSMETHERE